MKVKNGIASSVSLYITPVDAFGMRLQQRPEQRDLRRDRRQFDADDEIDQAAGRQREGDGIAEQQHRHHGGEHDRREIVGDEVDHGFSRMPDRRCFEFLDGRRQRMLPARSSMMRPDERRRA